VKFVWSTVKTINMYAWLLWSCTNLSQTTAELDWPAILSENHILQQVNVWHPKILHCNNANDIAFYNRKSDSGFQQQLLLLVLLESFLEYTFSTHSQCLIYHNWTALCVILTYTLSQAKYKIQMIFHCIVIMTFWLTCITKAFIIK